MKFLKLTTLSVLLPLSSVAVKAQDQDFSALQENLSIFAGILEESLELNQSSGLFGMPLGGVDSSYLYGQGDVFEIRTPLATQRNRVNLSFMNSAVENLQRRGGLFESASAPTAAMRTPAAASSADGAASLYEEMMGKIANVDYSLAINTAIQQASDAARSLRNLGSVDDGDYAEIQQDLETMRDASQRSLSEIREMTESINSTSINSESDSIESITQELQSEFQQLLAKVEPLKQQALDKAAELKLRSAQAQAEFASDLEADIAKFESDIFVLLCNYGGTLRELPANERISIVLDGLGENDENSEKANKIFVILKSDVEQCLAGNINAAALEQSAIAYSY